MLSCIIIILIIGTIIFIKANKIEKNETATAGTTIENNAPESSEHMRLEVDSAGIQVPVPIGYVGSKATGENTVKTGYVIYEGEEEVNNTNVAEAQKTRNQYVWIPVPNAKEIYGIDANGKLWGKELYYMPKYGEPPVNWSESNGIMERPRKNGKREPDIVTRWDTDSKLRILKLGAEIGHEFLARLELEFNEMIKSVETYGGFYIGRYETGDLNKDIAVIKRGNTNISSQNWYTAYKKCKTLKGDNKNIETEMLWGCQFDRTLNWLIESGNKTKKQINENSMDWGNYYYSKLTYMNTSGVETVKQENSAVKIPAGSSEQTKSNNIYDLAGNVDEWTKKCDSNNSRVSKGGTWAMKSSDNIIAIATQWENDSTFVSAYTGVRATLYIKVGTEKN